MLRGKKGIISKVYAIKIFTKSTLPKKGGKLKLKKKGKKTPR